jgi:hypothetical protein
MDRDSMQRAFAALLKGIERSRFVADPLLWKPVKMWKGAAIA